MTVPLFEALLACLFTFAAGWLIGAFFDYLDNQ